ncbi:IS3 family transposase [Rhodococcus qingshengii]
MGSIPAACTAPWTTSLPTSSRPSITLNYRFSNRRCRRHRSGKKPGTVHRPIRPHHGQQDSKTRWPRSLGTCHHQRSCGTYGKRRIRAELLDTYEMNVNHKLVSAIMTEVGIAGLPRPGKRKPNLLGVESLSDRVDRGFTAGRPNELWFTDLAEHPARDGNVYCFAILDCSVKWSWVVPFPRRRIRHWSTMR